MNRLGRFFLELNLFKTNKTDELSLRIQRWSTRLYIPILFTAICILLVYTISNVQSKQIQIDNPSLPTYIDLYNQYGSVRCPCTAISIPYEKFIELMPEFHQVCSSDLISDEWIRFLYDKETTTIRYPPDFRATAFNQFQILQQLCQVSIKTIHDGVLTLYNSDLITVELLDENLFKAQVEADISASQMITSSDLTRSLTFMRLFTTGNELLTGIQSAYTLIIDGDTTDIDLHNLTTLLVPPLYTDSYIGSDGTMCGCDVNVSCHMPAGFYNFTIFENHDAIFNLTENFPFEFVDGWNVGCWPIESLLVSTLESFYNQTILNQILININSSILPEHFNALDISKNSTFNPNSPLQNLVDQLFVEQWIKNLNYSLYFSQCQPQFCQYNINQRPATLYIITSLLGLYGGLSVVLHFIIPHIVGFILKRTIQTENETVRINRHLSIREWIETIFHHLFHLNLYRSSSRIEPNDIKQQLWSTRLYIFLLSLALFILTLYSSITKEIQLIQTNHPSLNIIEGLEQQGYTLTCPCQTLSVNYEDLFQLEPIYHQICSSVLITPEWINYLIFIADLPPNWDNRDFRTIDYSIFELLQSMCSLSNTTVNNALFQLGKTQLIANELLPIDFFSKQMNSIVEQFQLTLPNNLLSLLQLIRNITNVNQFISGGYSNFAVIYYTDENATEFLTALTSDGFTPISSDESPRKCLCKNTFTCETGAYLFHYDENNQPTTIFYTVPEFFTRCYPIESLFASTMECFYENNNCFEIIDQSLNLTNHRNWTLLNPFQSSHYAINVTIIDLVDQLFIDFWSTTLLYPSYLNQCQPIYCSYTINHRKSAVEIVTTITGLIGGLATILKLVSPYIISAGFYLIYRYRNGHVPRNNLTDSNANGNIWQRTIHLTKKVPDILLKLNIFEDLDNPSVDRNKLHIEQQSTRIYIISLLLIALILVGYTSLIYRSNQITMKINTLDDFLAFENSHRSILVNCPCTKLSTTHAKYYQIEPIFHEVCASDFVDQRWLSALLTNDSDTASLLTNPFTFIGTALTHFRALSTVCDLAVSAVSDAEELFFSTSIVSSQMPRLDLFYLVSNATIEDFQSTLSNNFIHNLQMFRGLAQGNGFVSVYSTNWNLFVRNLTTDQRIYTKSQSYGDCDCAVSSSCIQNSTPNILGYVIGCLPLESFLQSTLECLYDQLCVDQMSSYVQSSYIPKTLDPTKSTYALNTSINTIVQQLFIQTWSINVSYGNFFAECQPTSCSYTRVERYDVIYVITTLLGLYGGITILLRLIVPFMVSQSYKYIHRFQRTNRQVMPFD